ncbi:MAG TPA: CHAP domain-containing protein [Myxococcota bacterium]|nr:CHAP domain-containing protein [Myxococcota bacterium]
MLQLLPMVLGCSPVYRIPGSTASVGTERVRTSGPWADEEEPAVVEAHVSTPEDEPRRARRKKESSGGGEEVAEAAAWYIGKSTLSCEGENYRYDCSGFVDAAHARAGVDLGHKNTAALFALGEMLDVDHDSPELGDVIFFDNTYDRDGDGRLDDELSHVAIVEDIDDDGTLTLVHKGSKGVVRIWMNLEHPEMALSPEGKKWNSWLRARKRSDPRGTEYLTGQLYRGSASFWAAEELDIDANAEIP